MTAVLYLCGPWKPLPAYGQSPLEAHGSVRKIVATEFGTENPSTSYHALAQFLIPGLNQGHFARAYLGNGLIGIRPNPNPLSQSETVAAGYVFTSPADGFEMTAPAPYPLGTDIRIARASIFGNDGLVVRSQTLDMNTGELTTNMRFSPAGSAQLDIEVNQFLPRTVPSLLCQEIRLTATDDVVVEIRPQIQREDIAGTVYRDQAPSNTHLFQALGMVTDRGSKIGIATILIWDAGLQLRPDGTYLILLKRGQPAAIRTIAGLVTSAYDPAPDLQAIRVVKWGELVGFDELRNRNQHAWNELWKSRILVTGDETAQSALDAAFFYLHSSVNSSLLTGVPPFGVSQWRDYSGHIFWDMDAWIMPAVLPADPQSVAALVHFRSKGLDAAIRKAASFGFQGAMFPWEAGLDGSEVTPTWAETGWAEQHQVPEVAIAAWEYYVATGDSWLLHNDVWPILREVAEWISSRGTFTARGFEIDNIMGHDEGVSGVSNSSFVNIQCKMAVSAAIKAARAVGIDPSDRWLKIEKTMYIPIDNEKQVVLPFSPDVSFRYYNHKTDQFEVTNLIQQPEAYTLGNLQMLVFHNPPISFDLYKNTWKVEEEIRRNRKEARASTPASPAAPGFTTPPLAVCAAMFGDRRLAAELFRLAATKFAVPPFQISREYAPFQDGNYLMNQASLLMSALYGFTGLRISEGDWRTYPVSLPEGWKRIEIRRLWIRGKAYHLIAEQDKTASLEEVTDVQ